MTVSNGDPKVPEFRPHLVEWTPGKVQRTWDFYARHPVEFFSSTHSTSLASIVARECGTGPVADIGCGTGDLLRVLTSRGIRAIGVDSSPDIIAVARERLPSVEFHVTPGTSIPIRGESLAGAVLVEVVEHLDDPTLHAVLTEAHRVIRSGGKLVITTPNEEHLEAASVQCPDCGCEFHPMQHVRRWTAGSLSQTFSEHGFAPSSVRATQLVPNAPMLGRMLRTLYFGVRRRKPHLVAIGTRI